MCEEVRVHKQRVNNVGRPEANAEGHLVVSLCPMYHARGLDGFVVKASPEIRSQRFHDRLSKNEVLGVQGRTWQEQGTRLGRRQCKKAEARQKAGQKRQR